MNVAVYTIKENGNIKYVGKTKNFTRRKWLHLNMMGTHYSAIPTDINVNSITFSIISEFTDDNEALKLEDKLIVEYNTIENGWNKIRSGHVWNNKEYTQTYRQEYSKTYYQQHKEHIKKRVLKYQKENSEKVNERQRKYYHKNKENSK